MENDLLADEAADSLTALCRTAIGDSLRSITYFTRNDFEQLYLRDDLEQDADLMGFIGNEWQDFKTTQSAYEGTELGDYEFTIRVFENGYLVRVTTDTEGVFATADSLTLQAYEDAATAIAEVLEDR